MSATVEVRATAKGFYNGPRSPGDKFDYPLNKDGSIPKATWFVAVVKKPVAKPADDSDLA